MNSFFTESEALNKLAYHIKNLVQENEKLLAQIIEKNSAILSLI